MARETQALLRHGEEYVPSSLAEKAVYLLSSKMSLSLANFFIFIRKAYDESVFGTLVEKAYGMLAAVSAYSVLGQAFGYLFRLGFYGEDEGDLCKTQKGVLKPEVFLGFSLAVSAIFPTEIVFIFLFVSFGFVLVSRASLLSSYESRDPGSYGQGLRIEGLRIERKVYSAPDPWTLGLLIVLFFFLLGATVTSVGPRQSLANFIIWCFYLFAFLVAYDAGARRREEYVILPVLAFASISALIGIYQHLSGWQPPRSWLDVKFEDEIVRVVGTFSNPTFFAEMLGLALPVTIALLLRKRAILQRMLLLAYAGVQTVALVLTYSRGAWIGFIASFAILAVLYERKLLIVGLILGVLLLVLAPKVIVERLVSSFTLNDSSNSYRIFIWRGSFALLRANLFRGVGLGADSFVKVYPEYMIVQTPAPHAHSTYLEMLIELGLPGFLVLCGFLLTWAWKVAKAIISEKTFGGKKGFLKAQSQRWERIGVMAGLFSAVGGHMVQALVEHTWYSPRITIVYWAFLGLALGLASAGTSRDDHMAERHGSIDGVTS